MNAADILMYGFLLIASCVVAWVAWAAGRASAARLYAADLATARTAARHYRAERDGEAYVVRVECICDRLKSERRRTLSEVRRLSAEASSSFVEDSSASIALEWIGDKIDKLWRAT